MSDQGTILRFENTSFEYGHDKPILDEVSFNVRRGSKITIMGQNGGGKSTIFKLIARELHPESGNIHITPNLSIALSRQVIPREDLGLSVREFFLKQFKTKIYDIDPRIDAVLEVVNVHAPHERILRTFSGGQQARLLLASALIVDPDILLLDEPTNNLDTAGIEHLTAFIKGYKKTVIVISHDSDFLNSFTDGVLYLDVYTRKVEQYVGNYYDLQKEIALKIEKDNRKNALLAKEIQENKDKANFFANKGGQMRLVARRMRDKAEELEEEKVDIRKEDKVIRPFVIPMQENIKGELLKITTFTTMSPKTHKVLKRKANISIKKNHHLLLKGPNGIGKSTLLETLARGDAEGVEITPGVKLGYYRQDFSTLDFEQTVYESLISAMIKPNEEAMRSTAAGFLITGDVMKTKIGSLSEGQKGLVAFARLVLERPGILILDEPTNHINFRHLPIIAKALSAYEGAMILVSHVPEFVKQIRIDETLDLAK
ncbi:MAG: transporter family protein ATP-binding cassette, subfamily er 3 [Parcubacteria group bacterium]|nr:transporter family protein ATP-binding cassette, subfamily er 3 [Parcubacteria group bacterium]